MRGTIFWMRLSLLLALLALARGRAGAVEVLVNGTASYNTTDPGSQIPNWTSGWAGSGIDGWDYVGTVQGADGVYLGNNWVLTARHVGAGNFTLDGTTYDMVPGSAQGFTEASGSTVDLTIFELETAPPLPALQIAASTPLGSNAVMIGGGGGKGQAWGYNAITATDVPVSIGANILTWDFQTAYGPTASGTNNAVLVVGDSGGGDFVYDSATGTWMLAGINEAVDETTHDSYMIQTSSYLSQIQQISGVPEPTSGPLCAMALLTLPGLEFARRKLRSRKTGVL
jgi:hypothetical protein